MKKIDVFLDLHLKTVCAQTNNNDIMTTLFRSDWFQSVLGGFLSAQDVGRLVPICGTWQHLLHDSYENRKVFLAAVKTNNVPLCRYVVPVVANIFIEDGLVIACKLGHTEVFRYLLNYRQPNSVHQLWMISSLYGRLDIIKLLYQYKDHSLDTTTYDECVSNSIKGDRDDVFFWLMTIYPSYDHYTPYFYMICSYHAFRILDRLDFSLIDEREFRYTFLRMCIDDHYRVLDYFPHNPTLSLSDHDHGFIEACLYNNYRIVRHFLAHAPVYLSAKDLDRGYDIAIRHDSKECVRLVYDYIYGSI